MIGTTRTTSPFATLVALLAALALAGCEDLGPEPDPPFGADAPGQTIARTRIIWSDSGRTSALIVANMLERHARRDEIVLRDSVQVDIYGDDGSLAARVSGDLGIIDERTRIARVDSGIVVRVFATDEYKGTTLTADQAYAEDFSKQVRANGNVRIVSEAGAELVTNTIIWDGRQERYYAPGFVRLTNGTEVEEGIDFNGNADLTRWTMRGISGRSKRPIEDFRERARREREETR